MLLNGEQALKTWSLDLQAGTLTLTFTEPLLFGETMPPDIAAPVLWGTGTCTSEIPIELRGASPEVVKLHLEEYHRLDQAVVASPAEGSFYTAVQYGLTANDVRRYTEMNIAHGTLWLSLDYAAVHDVNGLSSDTISTCRAAPWCALWHRDLLSMSFK